MTGADLIPDARTMPAWRIAWFHPCHDRWLLGLYEYRDQQAAEAVCEWLRGRGDGEKAELIPCQSQLTGHGVEA